MFQNWSHGDWIALVAILLPVLVASLGALWLTARRIGSFEAEFEIVRTAATTAKANSDQVPGMLDRLENVEVKADGLGKVDTAVQLLAQSVKLMTSSIAVFQEESREARRETATALATFRAEFRDEMKEVRHDLNNVITGRITPATRRSRS